MTLHNRLLLAPLFVVLLFVASACSRDGASSPTSPSVNGQSRGAVISGHVTGLSSRAAADVSGPMAASSVTVTVAGTNISSVIDGSGDFTMTGVPPGDVQLRFAGNGVSASVTLTGVQASDRITVMIALNGNGAKVESEHRDRDNDVNDNELKGAVSGLTGTCPALTFTVQSTTVKTSSATQFDDGPCTRIANGARVEAKGARQPDGSLMATRVELDD